MHRAAALTSKPRRAHRRAWLSGSVSRHPASVGPCAVSGVQRSCVSPSTSSTVTVMRFSVRVPVLSEQMTVTEPRVSTAGSLRMRAWRLSMRWAPRARAMVTTAGSPSGTAATAMLMAVRNINSQSSPRSRPRTKTTATMTRASHGQTRAPTGPDGAAGGLALAPPSGSSRRCGPVRCSCRFR